MVAAISPEEVSAIASRLVQARMLRRQLDAYPGPIPTSLADAYAIQEAAIAQWPDNIAGWKLGRIGLEVQAEHGGRKKLAGPVFTKAVLHQPGLFASIPGGLCAIEGELIIQLGTDLPVGVLPDRQALQLAISKAFAGIEMALSPYTGMNDHGPAATASDFCVNGALILGSAMELQTALAGDFECEVLIEGVSQGRRDFRLALGDPVSILKELVEILFERGRGLKAGDLVSTGAITGVHAMPAGQSGSARFFTPEGVLDVNVSVE
jgi:2-keto-4-pentenoate hydratase